MDPCLLCHFFVEFSRNRYWNFHRIFFREIESGSSKVDVNLTIYFKFENSWSFSNSFPFDAGKSPIFDIVLLIYLIAYCAMTLFIAVNFLFFVIGNNIATHFRVLQVDWRNYDFSNNKFEELVDRHLKIFDCCDLFKKIYAPLLLIKFGTMAVVIGLLGFETIIVRF
jgi:hypothetical protein